ncbi:MAG: nicotinate (nicotinamide) nucleotide adenylyltransferase [Phycisphaerae bacterium]|nr:nicotinate (nicotinamide) nucleotide adenylyltransferase [Phycisphaerae bacterium]
MTRLLLFGGSFDPIHHGHLIVARAAAEHLGISRVILVPCAAPPHKPDRVLAPSVDRLAMCRVATAGEALFEVDDFEVRAGPPCYSLRTVRHYAESQPDVAIHWLIGADSLRELTSWHRIRELADACTFVTAARPGCAEPDWASLGAAVSPQALERIRAHVLPTPEIMISASAIRARVRAGRSVRYLVPDGVIAYVGERGLYRG